MHTVTKVDRDAVQRLECMDSRFGLSDIEELYRAFAAHRIAERDRCVQEVRDVDWYGENAVQCLIESMTNGEQSC